MGYGDYQIKNVTISKDYYVEGLGHNLFFVGQFCDSDLEAAFWKHTCFVRNLEGVDLLIGFKDSNLCTLSLDNMLRSSLICLLSKASKTKSWLWIEAALAVLITRASQRRQHGKSEPAKSWGITFSKLVQLLILSMNFNLFQVIVVILLHNHKSGTGYVKSGQKRSQTRHGIKKIMKNQKPKAYPSFTDQPEPT
nr:integrase, catalytic region, zinc finger, CCHC-type, peptidase aspartic, catalytic [Tanacetum cinerariifolium]